MPKLMITPLTAPAPAAGAVEIVERKGTGHPDTICDALAEELSLALCRYYLDRFGLVLHHNVDKALLWGGTAQPAFGGGRMVAPMEIFMAGRATCEFKGVKVPVEELVMESGRHWLKTHIHALDPEKHVKLHPLIRPGSGDLVELYLRQKETGVALANDTSCGVGFAPLDELERLVLAVERHLNSATVKTAHPEIGEDIKVMCLRREGAIELTLACALVDAHVADTEDYLEKKAGVAALAREAAGWMTDKKVIVSVNTADDPGAGSLYLTVTGTSAEAGDDGEVGRGNRTNGLITPYRPMNMEAAAGKNPVTHVGKLYNLVAQGIAAAMVDELAEVTEAHCFLLSQIGKPIHLPRVLDLRLRVDNGGDIAAVKPHAEEIARAKLSTMHTIQDALIAGAIKVY